MQKAINLEISEKDIVRVLSYGDVSLAPEFDGREYIIIDDWYEAEVQPMEIAYAMYDKVNKKFFYHIITFNHTAPVEVEIASTVDIISKGTSAIKADTVDIGTGVTTTNEDTLAIMFAIAELSMELETIKTKLGVI